MPEQRISQPSVVSIRRVHVADRAELTEAAQAEIKTPFDLGRAPLLRLTFMDQAPGQGWLLLVIDHLISDGWSMHVLFRELADLYADGQADIGEIPIQYADFAVWQREQMSEMELTRQLGYWQDQLAAAPVYLRLPTDRPRPSRAGRAHRRLVSPRDQREPD